MFRFTQTIASSFGIAAISCCGPSGAVAGVRGRRGGGWRRRKGLWRENRSDALTESEVTERDISTWKDWFCQCRFTTCFNGIGRDACFLCLVWPVLPKEVDQEHNSLHKKSLGSVVFYVYFHFLLVYFFKIIISYSAFLVSSFFLSAYHIHFSPCFFWASRHGRHGCHGRHGRHVALRNFGWDAHGYDAPSALRRAAKLFEGPLAEVPPRDTGVKHFDFTTKKWGDLRDFLIKTDQCPPY